MDTYFDESFDVSVGCLSFSDTSVSDSSAPDQVNSHWEI